MLAPLMLTAVLFGLSADPAASLDRVTFDEVDVNNDGEISPEELRAVAPDVDEARFAQFDADGDGALDEAEFDVWLIVYAPDGPSAPNPD